MTVNSHPDAGDVTGKFEPFFLDRPPDHVFSVYTQPGADRPSLGNVLYIHPFAEEMNRSRRVAALMARAASQAGWGFLSVDLTGCGDSSGDFADARWDAWIDDIGAALNWLEARDSGPITLIGLRLGAIAAAEIARAGPDRIAGLVLWQPVTGGKTMLNQFLRVRVAAGMMGSGERETTGSLRERFEAGESVEIAGYEITPGLARDLDAKELSPIVPPVPVHWLEIASDPGRPVSPGANRVIENWREAGCDVDAETVAGEPFWNLQETTLAPALIERTTDILQRRGR